METRGKVLILGATGGIGGETARRLIQKKWDVRALKRGLHGSEQRDDIQWIGATFSTRTKSPRRRGCNAIVHAVNPPGYRNWEHLVLPMLRNTIDAAERTGALIVLPGTFTTMVLTLSASTGRCSADAGHKEGSDQGTNGERT